MSSWKLEYVVNEPIDRGSANKTEFLYAQDYKDMVYKAAAIVDDIRSVRAIWMESGKSISEFKSDVELAISDIDARRAAALAKLSEEERLLLGVSQNQGKIT